MFQFNTKKAGGVGFLNTSMILGNGFDNAAYYNRGMLNWSPNNGTTYTIQPGYYSGRTLNSSGAYNAGYDAGLAAADNRINTDNKSYTEGYNEGKIDAINNILSVRINGSF